MLRYTLILSLGLLAAITLGCEKKQEAPAAGAGADTSKVEDAADSMKEDAEDAMDEAADKAEEVAEEAGEAADDAADALKDATN